jgi:DNA repair photolyase
MKSYESARYEKSNITINKDRALTYSGIACPLNCNYCFALDAIYEGNNCGELLSDEQLVLLKQLPQEITTIRLGCDTEFLYNEREAAETLNRLVEIGKNISIITKLSVDDSLMGILAEVNNKLQTNGNHMEFAVSLTCTTSKEKWEPNAASIDERIETVRRASSAGIETTVVIRPLIPTIAPSEIDEIIDATKDYVIGYHSGPLYLKRLSEDTITVDEVIQHRCLVSEEVEQVHWMPDGNKFLKIESPELMAYLRNKVEEAGKVFFY